MSCSNQIICYTSPHLSHHVPFFFLLIILTHCYVIVYSFYYPPLQAYLQYKKSLSNIIHLSPRQIQIYHFYSTTKKRLFLSTALLFILIIKTTLLMIRSALLSQVGFSLLFETILAFLLRHFHT